MVKTIRVFCIVFFYSFLLISCKPSLKETIPGPVAFLDVNIIPMDHEGIVAHQTVVIRNKKIARIGPFLETEIPEEVYQINASGMYLMPGLVDMHVHIEHEEALILFIANGVTTVRNMWGYPKHLTWKKRILNGELTGPSIYSAGSLFDGPPGAWDGSVVLEKPEDAEQFVINQKEKGYDFIKIYYLQEETFFALLAAARKHNIYVIGHVSDDVGLEGVLSSGQHSIEHLDGYWMFLESDSSPFRDKYDYHSYLMKWNYMDETKMPAIATLTKSSGIWNCPTLVVYQRIASPVLADSFYSLPEMCYMDPVSLASWDPTTYFITKSRTDEEWEATAKMYPTLLRLTRQLHTAGAKLLLGTDTPNPFVVPGFSIHTELQNFIKAGMSPYEAIKTGTYNAAECLGELEKFGIIQTGKQADLILLKENPLEDVGNIINRCGVMVRGQWFSEEKLQKMLEDVKSSSNPPKNRFVGIPPLLPENKPVMKGCFELKYNDIPFGEERYILSGGNNGSFELLTQTVTDKPYSTFTMVKMQLNGSWNCMGIEYKNETSTGGNRIIYQRSDDSLEIEGILEGEEQVFIKRAISNDEMISPPQTSVCVSSVPVLASYLQINHKLASLNENDSILVRNRSLKLDFPYDILEETIKIYRLADSVSQVMEDIIPVRVYKLIVTSPHVSISSVLTTNFSGHLVSLETEQQIGILSFNLTDYK